MRRAFLWSAAALCLAGCVAHDGAWQAHDAAVPDPSAVGGATVSLVLVGNAGAPTRWAQTVGTALDAQLTAEHEAGREPIVLWLGGLATPRHPGRRRPQCPSDPSLSSRPGASAIAVAVAQHVQRGHKSYAVAGADDWACRSQATLLQAAADAGPNPWAMPDHHFVVRVFLDGSSRVVSRCASDRDCVVDSVAASGDSASSKTLPLVDLVVIDTVPWIAPPRDADDRRAKAAALTRMDALLAAVRAQDNATPRILVSSVPVEAAGFSGMGGGGSDAAYHYLPPALQAAVKDGLFAGSVASHDRALYADADISRAAKRSSRAWLSAPVFQIVSGSASLPDSRAGAVRRRLRYYRSNSYVAAAYSDRPGFAVVSVTPAHIDAVLYAARGRKWQTARVHAPLVPAPHPPQTASGPLNPCLRCEEIPAPVR